MILNKLFITFLSAFKIKMIRISTVLLFSLMISFTALGQWAENFNTKTGNDFTLSGWRFNEDGSFYFSTSNTFNMTSRHIRSQNIQSGSPIVTFTGYLYFLGGNSYTTSFTHSCVCWDVPANNSNALPKIEVSYQSFTTGNIVSTTGLFTSNVNTLNTANSTFTPTQNGWYRIRFTLSRGANAGTAAIAIDNITSNIPTPAGWNDTTVPMDQSITISASESIVQNGDKVKFTIDYTLNNTQWYTRVRGAQFQINLPAGFTYQSHTITGSNFDAAKTTYNSGSGLFTIWTNNVVPVIKLEINSVVTNAQSGSFASIYSSNLQPQNPNSSLISPTPITIIPNSTQPIELISFEAKANGKVNQLTWATATEKNNDYFSIERSADGINFNAIAKIEGAGDHTGRLDYSYTDLRPLNGNSYYRIRQTDYDGTFSVFQAVRVQRNDAETAGFKIVGNPSSAHRIIMQLNVEENVQISTVKIFDNSGSLVAQKQLESRDLYNKEFIMDGLNLAKGLHIVSFETGNKKFTERLLVK